jgi:hypothetical protein
VTRRKKKEERRKKKDRRRRRRRRRIGEGVGSAACLIFIMAVIP